MAKKESDATASDGGLAIGSMEAQAGRDVNVAGQDITTGGVSFQADWRDSAMSALGDAHASPVVRSHVEHRLDAIQEELAKDEPDTGLVQRLVGEVEQVIPIVATVLRTALPFLK